MKPARLIAAICGLLIAFHIGAKLTERVDSGVIDRIQAEAAQH